AGDAGHKATCQVTGTNGMGSTDTSATITVHASAHFKASTPPIAHLGKKYSYTFATTGSPTPKITRVSGTLPPGLKLASNGTLSGTPTRKGTYKLTLSANNGIGTPAKTTKSVTVR
ncbi:MAG: Fibronectin type domain protein, partial [Massilia sp.]|nr:Fibronectin type domain protein [Massilia sp.]